MRIPPGGPQHDDLGLAAGGLADDCLAGIAIANDVA
jgi:hypothetical protein